MEEDYFSGAVVPVESTPECVIYGSGWVVSQHDLKLPTRCPGSGAFQEVQAKVIHHLYSVWGHQDELQSKL